jgi:iturin family lipopeptide synthetase B
MKKFDEKNIEDLLALTPMQEGMLFHYLKNPGNNNYFEQLILEISGKIEVEIFEKAWNFVIGTNEMLRTVFRWRQVKKPVQLVLKVHNFKVNYKEAAAEREEPFDLQEVPFRVTLGKIEDNRYRMVVTNHHILYDGWSNRIILEEFFAAYQLLSKGKGLKPPIKTPFKEFIKWLQHQDKQQQKSYWQAYLEGFIPGTGLGEITAARYRENEHPGKGKRVKSIQTRLTGSLRKLLEQRAAKYKLTPAVIFYTAWGTLLQRCTNCNDVAVGTTVSGRNAPVKDIENMVGLFINTVPFRVQDHGSETIKDMLERLQSALQERSKYESTPLVDIRRYSEHNFDNELFDTLVVVENYPLAFDDRLLPGDDMFSIESYNMVEQTHYDLSVGISLFDEIDIRFTYDSSMFSDDMAAALANRFMSIINFILEQPGKCIYEIDILSKEEKRQLLIDFNDTAADYPRDKTLHRLFAEQVERRPDNTAVIGANPRVGPHCLTYKELNKKSDQLAVTLQEKGVTPDTIVGIMIERSIDMVIGMLGILKAGGAYLPIDPDYPEERKQYMLKDSSAKILLKNNDLSTLSPFYPSTLLPFYPSNPTNLAYIIYTSGTTGKPKGTLIEHKNVVRLLFNDKFSNLFTFSSHDTWTLFHSFCFDFSVWEMYGALLYGGRLIIVSKITARDTEKFLDILETGKVTVLNQTPSAFYNLAAGSLADEERKLDLRYIIFGGEALNPPRLEKWAKKYPHTKLINMYGITETTVHVTYKEITPKDTGSNISNIGKPIPTLSTYVMDRNLRLLPLGVPGELCVGGEGVARGYLNRPGLTAKKFVDNPYLTGEVLYRSGDLVKLSAGGDMEYLGRIDHQVKIRGHRVELGEIESCLLEHRNIEAVVVVVREGKKDKYEDRYICAYIVPRSHTFPINIVEIKDYLSRRLPDYMIPAYFVEMDQLPLTSNGKVDRKALPEPVLSAVETYAAPQDEVQERLVEVWSEVLGINAEVIGIDDNFFRLGGHSLKATSLSSQIHKILDVRVPLETIFQTPTIRGLAQYIKGTSGCDPYAEMEAAEKREYYPLSRNQQAFYMLHQYAKESKLFNVPVVLPLEGDVKKGKVETVFKALIQQHEALRTSFHMIDNKPVQRIHDPVDIGQWIVDSKGENINDFIRPFDLTRAPLLRVGLIKIEKEKYLLIMDMHHLVTDGTSVNILARDFWALYRGRRLSPSAIRYRDFVQWQNTLIKTGEMKAHEDYWVEQLSGDLPLLDMPTDFPRPFQKSFAGDSFSFNLGTGLSEGIRRLAGETGTTLYMVLLTAYTILLHKITGQTDIIIGSPVSGRIHPLLENTVGLVMDSVMMRNFPSGEKSIATLLQEVRQTTLEAFEHQVYPYEELIKKVAYKKSPGRNPIADVALTVLNMFEKETVQAFAREKDDPGPAPHEAYLHKTSKVDFTISAVDTDAEGETPCVLEYCTTLFKRESMERFAARFRRVLKEMVDNPNMQLWEIDMIAPGEKQELIGHVPRCYPLSHAQKRIYYTEKTYPETGCNTLAFTVRYEEILDKERLEEAIHTVISRNEGLRLRILEFDWTAEPYQYIAPYAKEPLDTLLFSVEGNAGEVYKQMDGKTLEPFLFLGSPLFYFAYIRFNSRESGYYLKLHHIVADGWTFLLLFEEIDTLYKQLSSGEAIDHTPTPSYIRYIGDEKAYLYSPQAVEDRESWHRNLLPLPDPANPSLVRDNSLDIGGGIEDLPFPGELRSRMHRYCKTYKTSPFKLIFAGLAIFISRAVGSSDIVIGSASHNRSTPIHKQMAGMFVSTVPFRVKLAGEQSFADLVERTGQDINRILKNQQKYPFDLLMDELRAETGQDPRYLLDVNLIGHGDVNEDRFKVHFHFPGYEPTPLSLHINANNREIRGILEIQWFYRKALFLPEEIRNMHRALVNILTDALENPGKKIAHIELLTAEEKHRLIYDFNDTARPYPPDVTFHELFQQQTEKIPDKTAVIGRGGDSPKHTLTYKELNEQSNRLAYVLKEKGVTADTIAALMVDRSVDMVIGILGILKAGGAYLPIDPEYPQDRIDYMLKDSGAKILIKKSEIRISKSETNSNDRNILNVPIVLNFDHLNFDIVSNFEFRASNLSSSELAYIIYTSGSTGKPKGVMVEYGNLMAYLNAFERQFNLTPGDIVIQQASFAFDAFVEELYPILMKGGILAVPAGDEVKDIRRLSAFIVRHGVTMITASPLMLDQLNRLDLNHFRIRIYISGGDVLKGHYIDRLLKTGEVYNTYGPTEATVCAAYHRCRAGDADNVPIGKPIANYRVYILDKNERLLPIGLPGELCISGPGVSRGYLNQPELTAEKFVTFYRSYRSYKTYIPGRLYKSGDLARWLPDGSVDFLGRIDSQVKVRGYRIEPGEIEKRLKQQKGIKEAVVIRRQDKEGDQYLCAYITAEKKINKAALREMLGQHFPDYMIPSYFEQLEKIPLTPNGKVDKKALPEPVIKMDEVHTVPRDEVEDRLAAIWSEVLGIPKEVIGIDSDFFTLGGHSLKAIILTSKIHQAFKVKLSMAEIFTTPFIRAVAQIIKESGKTNFVELEKAEKKEFYPLSFNQRRLFILHRLDPRSPAYNMPARMVLHRRIDEKIVEKILNLLVERHESLRTGFKTVNDEPVQYVVKTIELPFSIMDISSLEEDKKRQKREEIYADLAAAPFDLDTLPLFRSILVKLEAEEYEFMFNMHHLVTDGSSIEILKKDFFQLYDIYSAKQPAQLKPLEFQYKDFSQWHNKQLDNSAARSWKQKLAGGIPPVQLPADFSEGIEATAGAAYRCMIDKKLKEKLLRLAEQYRTSLFTVMFSLYMILLARVCRQDSIGCSVIASGREHISCQDIVGLFVNSILFKSRVDRDEPFDTFIQRMHKDVMESFQYQSYPMERVFEELNIRYPVIPVSFNMLNLQDATRTQQLDSFEPDHIDITQDIKFDLEPYIIEYENGIEMRWVYRKALFEPATIEYIINLYIKLLEFFTRDPEQTLNRYQKEEKKKKTITLKKGITARV